MLKVGDRAPDIQVHTDTGEDFRLSDMKGKRVVLYGCTSPSGVVRYRLRFRP